MRTLEIANANVMRMAIQQEIVRSDESRQDHRLHGLLLVTGGNSCQQVAKLFSEDRRTVRRWVTRFETHGLTGLCDGECSSRPATLGAEQWTALGRDLRRDPQKFSHTGHLWDGTQFSAHLRLRYRVVHLCAPVPRNLWPNGISAAQAQPPSRPVRSGNGRGV